MPRYSIGIACVAASITESVMRAWSARATESHTGFSSPANRRASKPLGCVSPANARLVVERDERRRRLPRERHQHAVERHERVIAVARDRLPLGLRFGRQPRPLPVALVPIVVVDEEIRQPRGEKRARVDMLLRDRCSASFSNSSLSMIFVAPPNPALSLGTLGNSSTIPSFPAKSSRNFPSAESSGMTIEHRRRMQHAARRDESAPRSPRPPDAER